MKHIAPWFELKATPDLSRREAILALFWQAAHAAIEGLDPGFPSGHFEAEHGASRVQSYRDHNGVLACLRILHYAREKTTRIHIYEAALAHPATKPALLGLRAWCVQPGGGRVSSGIPRPALWDALTSADLINAPTPGADLPHFDQLLAVIRESENPNTNDPASNTLTPENPALAELAEERDYYRQLAENQQEQLRSLTDKLRAAQTALNQKDLFAETPFEEVLEPRDLDHLPLWAAEHDETLMLLPRAFAGAKRSLYQNDEDIFKALEFLAGPYRQHRSGLLNLESYQQKLAESGLRLSGSASYVTATSQGDAYFVRYKGQRQFLEWHLVKGGGRDPRYCLRIYFFWDAADKKAVVGWLPSHLDNSLT